MQDNGLTLLKIIKWTCLIDEFVDHIRDLAADDDDAFAMLVATSSSLLDTACAMYKRDVAETRKTVYEMGPQIDEVMEQLEEKYEHRTC